MSNTDKPSLWRVMKSVAASVFGVQSQQNYQQDFETSRSFVPYVLVGVVFVAVLVLGIVAIVNIALA